MKLTDVIILTLSIGFLLIGIHQSMLVGVINSYWIFMISISLLLLYRLRKKKNSDTSKDQKNSRKNP